MRHDTLFINCAATGQWPRGALVFAYIAWFSWQNSSGKHLLKKKHLSVAFLCGLLFNVIGSERSSLLGQLVSVSTPFCIDRQRSFVNYLFTSASCNNWEQNKLVAPRSPKRPFPDESLFRLIPLKVTDTPSFRSNSACSLKHVLKWDKITETL